MKPFYFKKAKKTQTENKLIESELYKNGLRPTFTFSLLSVSVSDRQFFCEKKFASRSHISGNDLTAP